MQEIRTIESVVSDVVPDGYEQYVQQAVVALSERENAIVANILELAGHLGYANEAAQVLHDATEYRHPAQAQGQAQGQRSLTLDEALEQAFELIRNAVR